MKRKLLLLSLGVLGLFSTVVNAQPTTQPPPAGLQGIFYVTAPNVLTQVTPNPNAYGIPLASYQVTILPQFSLQAGTIISFQNQQYQFVPVASVVEPNVTAGALTGLLNSYNFAAYLPGNSTAMQVGAFAGQIALVPVPFDFGISAVLGAGAFAAVRTARNRKKQQAQDAAIA